MTTRTGVALLFAGALLIAAAYAACFAPAGPPAWAAWLFAGGAATLPIGALVLAAAGPRTSKRLAVPFAITWYIVFGGFAAALLLPAGAMEPLWLGLPRRAAIIIYGVGLLPILVLPVAYALAFDSITLRAEDVQRIRDAARATRADSSAWPDTR